MSDTTLTISSKNYSSWSLRGWLLCKMAGLDFAEQRVPPGDESSRAEILLMSPSFLVPCLRHNGVTVWDTLAIAEYLAETLPDAGLYPADAVARAHCRSISGEMHAGFSNLRAALPMNLRASRIGFRIWAGARADIERIAEIWRDCLHRYRGPYLFGSRPTVADAMFAPVATRFKTYDVTLQAPGAAYCAHILAWPLLVQWIEAALAEPDEFSELDQPEAEF